MKHFTMLCALSIAAQFCSAADGPQIPIGTWQLQSRILSGVERATPSTYLTFTSNRFDVTVGGTVVESGETTFDTSTTPSKYNAVVTEPGAAPPRRYYAIYRIEEDVLTACVNVQAGGPRPTAFDSPTNTSMQVATWVRVKPKESPTKRSSATSNPAAFQAAGSDAAQR